MTVTEFLQTNVAFLQGLTAEQIAALALRAEPQNFKIGHTVLFKGTTVDGLYVVASGRVNVWVKPEKNKQLVQVAELKAGDIFGETSIIEMGTAGATIKAAEDGTTIYIIPQDAFREILAQNSEFRSRVMALIAERKKNNSELKPALAAA